MISNIVFDLGSVLIDGDFTKALLDDTRIPNEYIEDLKKCWIIQNANFTETCTKAEYMKKVYERTPIYLGKYIPDVAEISISYLQPMNHTLSLINSLRERGYDLYYLSNWNKWSVQELKRTDKFDFLKLLDGGVFSYETGYMKPDRRIYEYFLKKYKLDPSTCIFFDDKKENITAAKDIGMKGILFTKEKGEEILSEFILNETVETFLTTNPFKKQMTLYHGTTKKLDIINPSSFNAGSKLSSPRMSSFWADEYTAKLFGVYRLIEDNGYIVSFTPDLKGLLVRPSDFNNIIKLLKSKPIYLYEKTLDKKYIGIGHSNYFDEYTIDCPVKPDSISTLKYNKLKDVVDNINKYPTDDIEKIRDITKSNITKISKMINNIPRKVLVNDIDYFKNTAKEYKKGQLMTSNESYVRKNYKYSKLSSSKDIIDFRKAMKKVFNTTDGTDDKTIKNMRIIKLNDVAIGYIGFSRYTINKKKYLGIGNFIVLPQYQRSGHGTNVIHDIIEKNKDKYDEIYCYVDKDNTKAINFYKKIAKVDTDNLTDYGYYVTLYEKKSSIRESPGYIKIEEMKRSEFILNESVKSDIDKDYKPKGKKSLSSFRKIKLDKQSISKYKNSFKPLKHIRDNCDGYIYFDKDKCVAVLAVEDKRDCRFIQAIEIDKDYQGYGLSKQLLSVAVNDLKATRLSVNKKNKLATDIYYKYGFKRYDENDNMIFMSINESYVEENNNEILNNIKEFNKELATYEYIVVNNNNSIIQQIKRNSFDNYETLSPSKFKKFKGGICWDYVAYESSYFKSRFSGIKFKTFFFASLKDNNISSTHTFLLFYLNDKVYWFEDSWKSHIGIIEYDSEDDALTHITNLLRSNYKDEWFIVEYNANNSKFIGVNEKVYLNQMTKLPEYRFKYVKNPSKKVIQSIKISDDGKISKINESYIEESNTIISYSNSFRDVKDIVDSLDSKEFKYICNRDTFIQSPYVIYREVLKVNGYPVSFIEIYQLPKMDKNTGVVVIATRKNPIYRHKGYSKMLVNRAIRNLKNTEITKLVWDAKKTNTNSIKFADSLGLKYTGSDSNNKSYELILEEMKRSELPDDVFGIPQERKYPMPDEKHTRSAIKLFNHVDPKYEKQLANKIIANMKKYNIPVSVVGDKNRLKKYLPKTMVKEGGSDMLDYMMGVMGYDSLNENAYDEWLEENMDASEEEKAAKKKELEEDFLNRRSKPAKNQKSHLNYMKNKMHSNKTNGATAQSELPTFNQFG